MRFVECAIVENPFVDSARRDKNEPLRSGAPGSLDERECPQDIRAAEALQISLAAAKATPGAVERRMNDRLASFDKLFGRLLVAQRTGNPLGWSREILESAAVARRPVPGPARVPLGSQMSHDVAAEESSGARDSNLHL
jgi:hypothetical protein